MTNRTIHPIGFRSQLTIWHDLPQGTVDDGDVGDGREVVGGLECCPITGEVCQWAQEGRKTRHHQVLCYTTLLHPS